MKNIENKTILFFPGWGFRASIWDSTLKFLSHFNTKVLDLPRNLEVDFEHQIFDIFHKEGRDKFIIVAWSLSGLPAIKFCHQYPHFCKKLILVNSLPRFVTTENWQAISQQVANQFLEDSQLNLEKVLDQFIRLVQYPNHSKSIKSFFKLNCIDPVTHQLTLLSHLEFLFSADYRNLFASLDIPILGIFGFHDAIVPIQSASLLEKLNKKSRVKILSRTGHAPFLTHTEEFVQCLRDDECHE